jgi:hypothetical protein
LYEMTVLDVLGERDVGEWQPAERFDGARRVEAVEEDGAFEDRPRSDRKDWRAADDGHVAVGAVLHEREVVPSIRSPCRVVDTDLLVVAGLTGSHEVDGLTGDEQARLRELPVRNQRQLLGDGPAGRAPDAVVNSVRGVGTVPGDPREVHLAVDTDGGVETAEHQGLSDARKAALEREPRRRAGRSPRHADVPPARLEAEGRGCRTGVVAVDEQPDGSVASLQQARVVDVELAPGKRNRIGPGAVRCSRGRREVALPAILVAQVVGHRKHVLMQEDGFHGVAS